MKAVFQADQVKQDLVQCIEELESIPPSHLASQITTVLSSVETRVSRHKTDVRKITKREALNILKDIDGLIEGVESRLKEWRARVPDTSPIRINNGTPYIHIELYLKLT